MPQAIGKHGAGPGVRNGLFDSRKVDLRDFVEESGPGLNIIAFFIIPFDEHIPEFFLHLGDTFVKKVVQNQVDLAL